MHAFAAATSTPCTSRGHTLRTQRILADRLLGTGCRVTCGACKANATASGVLLGLVGSAVGFSLLVSGSSQAMEQLQPMAEPQVAEIATAAAMQSPVVPFEVQSDEVVAAPELVTDMDLEARTDTAESHENSFVSSLEWVVEEGLEVANFTETNFAAVGAPSNAMWLSNSPWCMVWDAYCNVLNTRPVATKLATGMVGTFLGDLLAQFSQGLMQTHGTVSSRRRSIRRGQALAAPSNNAFVLDFARTARLVGFSAIVGTPVAGVWFQFLDQYVMPTDPTNPLAVCSKVALDQVVMAPFMTSIFFATMAMLDGAKGDDLAQAVKSKFKPTLLANWTVWPLAHVINFALVPPTQRILYINVVNIAWTAFMSHMASGSESNANEKAPVARGSKQLQSASR